MTTNQDQARGPILGLDLGTRRTGIAISDPDGELSSAHSTVELPVKKLLGHVAELVAAHQAVLVVVGYPQQPSGQPSEIGRLAERVADGLRGKGIAVELWNEALTSWEAEQILKEKGVRPGRRGSKEDRGAVDRVAAALMLQDFLDHRRRSSRDPETE